MAFHRSRALTRDLVNASLQGALDGVVARALAPQSAEAFCHMQVAGDVKVQGPALLSVLNRMATGMDVGDLVSIICRVPQPHLLPEPSWGSAG